MTRDEHVYLQAIPPACEPVWRELASVLPTPFETSFLRACLHGGPSGRDAWAAWSLDAGDWPTRFTREPAHHGVLLPLLYRALKRNVVQMDASATTFLREAYLARVVEANAYIAVCDNLLRVLSEAGLPCIVLKGAALRRTVYPNPALRPAGDIDLLLREADLHPAADQLHAAGWRWKEPPVDFGRHHLSPLEHKSGLTVELHRRLFSAYYELPIEDLWARSVGGMFGEIPSRVLSPEDALVHVCGHAARCQTRESLRWVADAWFLLAASPAFDWERFLLTSADARLALPVAIMLTYLALDIDLPVPPFVLERLWDEASRTDEMGREAARLGAQAAAPLRLRDVVASPEPWPAKMSWVRQRMFPPASEIRLSHGVDEARASGYHAYRFWCFALRTLRRR